MITVLDHWPVVHSTRKLCYRKDDRILDLFEPEIAPLDPPSPKAKTPP